jgi:hypothetical protein
MSSTEEQFLYEEPSTPIGRMQSGLAASIVTPSQKKRMEMATELSMTNLSSTRGSHQARWL